MELISDCEYILKKHKIINKGDVIKFGKTENIDSSTLPSKAININSSTGNKLRARTVKSGKENTTVMEVYMGWKADYAKGIKKGKS